MLFYIWFNKQQLSRLPSFFSELFKIVKYPRISGRLFCISNPDSGVNRPVYSWFLDLSLHLSTRLSVFLAELMICLYCYDFNLKWLNMLISLIAISIIDATERDNSCVVNNTIILDNLSLLKCFSLILVSIYLRWYPLFLFLQTSWIILLFRGYPSNSIFIFDFCSEDITREFTSFLIKWSIFAIRNIGSYEIGCYVFTHFYSKFTSLNFDVRSKGNIFSIKKVDNPSNNKFSQ